MRLIVHELVARERKPYWYLEMSVQLLREHDVDLDLHKPIAMRFVVQAIDLAEGLATIGQMAQRWETSERRARGKEAATT